MQEDYRPMIFININNRLAIPVDKVDWIKREDHTNGSASLVFSVNGGQKHEVFFPNAKDCKLSYEEILEKTYNLTKGEGNAV